MSGRKYATIEDVKPINEAIQTLNREMGVVQGELTWIRRIVAASFLLGVSKILMEFLGVL